MKLINKERILIILSVIVLLFSLISIFNRIPLFLQNYCNNFVSENLIQFSDYQKNVHNHLLIDKVSNIKSAYLKYAVPFSAKHLIESSGGPYYYNNIYDEDLTNLVVINIDDYDELTYQNDELGIQSAIKENLKNGFFKNHSFYIKQNYSYKNWIYSNLDNRKNIINISLKQVEKINSIISPKLLSFDENEKFYLTLKFTIAHEMAHTQKYQLLTDIGFSDKEALSDLSAVIYILKSFNFERKKSNEVIDAIELFRKRNIANSDASGYYNPYNYLEILRILLNDKNPTLFNVKHSSINELVIKISQYKLLVKKEEVKKYIPKIYITLSNNKILENINEYNKLLKKLYNANQHIPKGDIQILLSLAQTYNTSVSRTDAISIIRLNEYYSSAFNINLKLQKFKRDNPIFISLIDTVHSLNIDSEDTKITSSTVSKMMDIINAKIDIPLEHFLKIYAITDYDKTSNLIDNIEKIEYANKDNIRNKF